jgi:hypothetical protein
VPHVVLRCLYPLSRDVSFALHRTYRLATIQTAYAESVNEKIGKVMTDAFFAALAAFLFGVCLAGTIKHVDGFYLVGTAFWGALPIFGMFWTRRAVRSLLTAKYTTSEMAKRSARQLVLFCLCFALNSVTFGLEVMAAIRYSSDGLYLFSACFLGILTWVWFFRVHGEARRLTTALV